MAFDEMYSCIELIRILKNTDKFTDFVKSKKEKAEKLFMGYRLMIKTIQRFFLSGFVEWENCIDVKEDMLFYRIKWHGIKLDETTSNCQKMILVRNITEIFRKCWKAKNFKELEISIEECERKIFYIFDRTFSNADIPPNFPAKKDAVINQNMKEVLWTFLADTHRDQPHGYHVAFLDRSCDKRKETIKGYKFALAFLVNFLFPKDKNETKKILKLIDEWRKMDKSFSILRKITGRDRKNAPINLLSGTLFIKRISKEDFKKLLNVRLYKKPNLNIKQKLNEALFWYDLEVLPQTFFCGVGGLISILKGLLSDAEKGGKIDIIRFIHPVREKQNTYSYAVLIKAGGIISDSSGWILFFDIATDFSGQGSTNLEYIEQILKKNKKWFNIRNIKINLEEFKKTLYISDKGSISLTYENKKIRDKIPCYKQLATELLVYNYLISSGFVIEKWSYNTSIGEIDFIAKKKKMFYLIEVTTTLNLNKKEISKLIKEFSKKKKEVKKEFKIKTIRKELYVSHVLKKEHYNLLKKNNIKIIEMGDSFFEMVGIRTNTRKIRDIKDLLRFNADFPYY